MKGILGRGGVCSVRLAAQGENMNNWSRGGCVVASALVLFAAACSSGSAPTGGGNPSSGPSSVSGSWTGSLSSPGTTAVGIRFALQEQAGQLTGQTYVEDPVSAQYVIDDTVTGTRSGSDATWQTSTSLVVKGKFDADGGFAGTLEFPPDDPLAVHVVDLKLHR